MLRNFERAEIIELVRDINDYKYIFNMKEKEHWRPVEVVELIVGHMMDQLGINPDELEDNYTAIDEEDDNE